MHITNILHQLRSVLVRRRRAIADSGRARLLLLTAIRHLRFRGKGRLLDALHIGPSRVDVVPPGILSVQCIQGVVISAKSSRDIMFRELFLNGVYQDDVLISLAQLLKAGDVFWDVGANHGLMSLYVDKILHGSVKTIAFEPNPDVAEQLVYNVLANGADSVSVERLCLTDRIGTVPFYTMVDNSWNATVVKAFADNHSEVTAIEVPSSTIDDCVRRLGPPTVIKIDVEGAEHLVLHGGRQYLSRSPIPIIAEFNRAAILDAEMSGDQYLELYREFGYTIYRLQRPIVGLHKWHSRRVVHSASEIPDLCNLIMLSE